MICVNKAPPVEAVAWIPELHERRLSSHGIKMLIEATCVRRAGSEV